MGNIALTISNHCEARKYVGEGDGDTTVGERDVISRRGSHARADGSPFPAVTSVPEDDERNGRWEASMPGDGGRVVGTAVVDNNDFTTDALGAKEGRCGVQVSFDLGAFVEDGYDDGKGLHATRYRCSRISASYCCNNM